MDNAIFDDIQQTLAKEGADAAIARLCAALEQRKDYGALFYALLLKKRHELGIVPVPTSASKDIPEPLQNDYENAIRDACRRIGKLYLDEGNIPSAWLYYRMIGEQQPVAEALDRFQPEAGEDVQQVIEIAFHQGVNPRRGFDMLLKTFGLCSAITTASGEFPFPAEVRTYCVNKLIRTLHADLIERLHHEITAKEGAMPKEQTVRELIAGRDWLFADEFYHVDVSHLNSVVHMSLHLPPGPELDLARDLCAYGEKLSPRLQGNNDAPFENNYQDFTKYLAIRAGHDVEAGLAHFRAKADSADPYEAGTVPAEVLINLLLELGRPGEALEVARKHLTNVDGWKLSCPSFTELCQRAGNFQALADVARAQGDSVHFLAGLICAAAKA